MPKTPINYGGRRIGYTDLLRVINAERQGIKIDLHPPKKEEWTNAMQVELIEQRRLARVAQSQRNALLSAQQSRRLFRSHGRNFKSSTGIASDPMSESLRWVKETGGTEPYFKEQLRQQTVGRSNVLYLPRSKARIQLQDYSVTTQGMENVQVFKSENTLTSCKIPNFLQSQT